MAVWWPCKSGGTSAFPEPLLDSCKIISCKISPAIVGTARISVVSSLLCQVHSLESWHHTDRLSGYCHFLSICSHFFGYIAKLLFSQSPPQLKCLLVHECIILCRNITGDCCCVGMKSVISICQGFTFPFNKYVLALSLLQVFQEGLADTGREKNAKLCLMYSFWTIYFGQNPE